MSLFGKKKNIFAAKERVLIFEVNWLGDVLFSTPAIRAIRKRHPGAYIAAILYPRCKQVLLGNNYIDEVMVLDEGGRHKGFLGKLRLLHEIKARHFSICYLFKTSASRIFLLFLAGIRKRIGFARGLKGLLLTEKVKLPAGDFHRADIYYYLVSKSKIPEGERHYDFFVTSEDKQFIDVFLKKHGIDREKKIAALHIAGNWELKRWPKENFASLVDILFERFGSQVILTGSFLEHNLAKSIIDLCRNKPLIACGMTTLKQLGALFQIADVVVSADSGPLHIALAVGAKTVALFGPTAPEITGPLGRNEFEILSKKNPGCSVPCYNLLCKDNVCMKSITPEDVAICIEEKGWLKYKV